MNDDKITLRVNGINYTGWKDVSITAGITMACRTFSFGATFPWANVSDVLSTVKVGDRVEVLIGVDTVATGYVTATPISYNATGITVQVDGVSKTSDVVDCSPIAAAPEGVDTTGTETWTATGSVPATGTVVSAETPDASQWRNKKAEQIAADLCAPYGVEVVAEVDTGDPVTLHAIEPSETVFESISRLLTLGQLFLTDDEAGRLVFTEPGARGIVTGGLELGVNILSASADLDGSEVFSDYVVEGQHSGTDDAFGKDASHLISAANDAESRFRMAVLPQSGEMSTDLCRRIAEFERNRRRALMQSVTYTVVGWRDPVGRLWRPNTQVYVKDKLLGIDGLLLVAEVTYELSDAGSITTLSLAPIDAFKAAPTEAQKAAQSESGGASWLDDVK